MLLPRVRAQLVGAGQSRMSRNSWRTSDKLTLTLGVMVVKHPRCPIACHWLCKTTMCKDICYRIRQFIIRHDSERWSVSGLKLCSLILATTWNCLDNCTVQHCMVYLFSGCNFISGVFICWFNNRGLKNDRIKKKFLYRAGETLWMQRSSDKMICERVIDKGHYVW